MSAWLVPIICALIAGAGGLYAARGKKATDQGDLAQKLVDQLQEERTRSEGERDRLIEHRRADADYIVALRRQVEELHGTPLPYPQLSQ